MNYLIGIDIGTSGTKTVLFDEDGKIEASHLAEYPLYQPQNGWAEQEPDDWWDAVVKTLRAVIEKSGISPASIVGIGLSGQMHGLVMVNKDGKPLRRAILWCDGRTSQECKEITRRVGADRLIEISANPALTGFTAGKILWVRKNEPELYKQCYQMLLPKDYIRYRLTGVYAAEVSDASGTNLLDVPNRCWSKEILEQLDMNEELLPPIFESYHIAGTITREAARLTGLAEGTPVVCGAGDNAAAAIGTGAVNENRALTTIGTSGVVLMPAKRAAIDLKGRVHTFCSAVPGEWMAMSCTLAAGFSLQWLRNQFFVEESQTAKGLGIDTYVLMNQQAEKSPIGSNRLLFLPYLMGERSPILDENARGVFFGLSGMHTKYDMLRAVMEGVAYSQKECLDILQGMGFHPKEMIACGGGGRSPFWRQMLADIYDCPVSPSTVTEGPALGAAILAGTGTKLYSSVEEASSRLVKVEAPHMPIQENHIRYEPYYEIYCSLYPILKDSFQRLASL